MMTSKGVNLIPMTISGSTYQNKRYVLQFLASIALLLFNPFVNFGFGGTGTGTMTCISTVHLSVPVDGEVLLIPQMFLTGDYNNYNDFEVDVMGDLEDVVSCDEIGAEIMVVVRDINTNNNCMSQLILEDKIKPQIENCNEVHLDCYDDINIYDIDFFISVSDNCTDEDDLHIWYTEVIEKLDCNEPAVKVVHREWFVEDEYGNVCSCMQYIYLDRVSLNLVNFPDDVTIYCPDLDLDPEILGFPELGGMELDDFCDIVSWHVDTEIPLACDGNSKVNRVWTIMDWCTGDSESMQQDILILDTIPPEIDCPEDITINADNFYCTGNYMLPVVDVTDECSNNAFITKQVEVDGLPYYIEGDIVVLDLGVHTIKYFATDACGNEDSCSYKVFVEDLIPPIIYCGGGMNPLLQIPLMSDDTVMVPANLFNLTIVDNCMIADTLIRRTSSTCGMDEDLIFGDKVTFCCDDVVDNVQLEIKVIDEFGNADSCMFLVDIKIPLPPNVLCYNDVTVCLDEFGMVEVDPLQAGTGSGQCNMIGFELTPNIFNCVNLGANIVEFKATNAEGSFSTCDATITVEDKIVPTAVCQDITLYVDDMGNTSFDAQDLDGGSTDNCPLGFQSNPDVFNCMTLGVNPVVLTVSDDGGNTATCDATVTVLDTISPVCMVQDITIDLPADGDTLLTSMDIVDGGSTDNCDTLTLTFAPDPLLFACNHLPPAVNVVTVTATDLSGNTSACTFEVVVQDPAAACNPFTSTVDGLINTESGKAIPDIRIVGLGYDVETNTDQLGKFVFPDLEIDESITLIAEKTDDWLNGITVNDVALIQKHITGLKSMSSSYELIAADLDRSGNVSVHDIIELEKLVLKKKKSIENNQVWRFVDANYDFPVQQGPIGTAYPESVTYRYGMKTPLEFVGIKVGDLDGDVQLKKQNQIVDGIYRMEIEDKYIESGRIVEISIPIDLHIYESLQMELIWDQDVEIIGYKFIPDGSELVAKSHLNKSDHTLGLLAYSFSNEHTTVSLDIEMMSQRNSQLSENLGIVGSYQNLVFNSQGQKFSIQLDFVDDNKNEKLISTTFVPNPFNEFTEIIVPIPGESEERLELKVFDSTGNLVLQREQVMVGAHNTIVIHKDDLPAQGIYFVTIQHGKHFWNHKIIAID